MILWYAFDDIVFIDDRGMQMLLKEVDNGKITISRGGEADALV